MAKLASQVYAQGKKAAEQVSLTQDSTMSILKLLTIKRLNQIETHLFEKRKDENSALT